MVRGRQLFHYCTVYIFIQCVCVQQQGCGSSWATRKWWTLRSTPRSRASQWIDWSASPTRDGCERSRWSTTPRSAWPSWAASSRTQSPLEPQRAPLVVIAVNKAEGKKERRKEARNGRKVKRLLSHIHTLSLILLSLPFLFSAFLRPVLSICSPVCPYQPIVYNTNPTDMNNLTYQSSIPIPTYTPSLTHTPPRGRRIIYMSRYLHQSNLPPYLAPHPTYLPVHNK